MAMELQGKYVIENGDDRKRRSRRRRGKTKKCDLGTKGWCKLELVLESACASWNKNDVVDDLMVDKYLHQAHTKNVMMLMTNDMTDVIL